MVVLEKGSRNAAQAPGQVLYYRWEKREDRGECKGGAVTNTGDSGDKKVVGKRFTATVLKNVYECKCCVKSTACVIMHKIMKFLRGKLIDI